MGSGTKKGASINLSTRKENTNCKYQYNYYNSQSIAITDLCLIQVGIYGGKNQHQNQRVVIFSQRKIISPVTLWPETLSLRNSTF